MLFLTTIEWHRAKHALVELWSFFTYKYKLVSDVTSVEISDFERGMQYDWFFFCFYSQYELVISHPPSPPQKK